MFCSLLFQSVYSPAPDVYLFWLCSFFSLNPNPSPATPHSLASMHVQRGRFVNMCIQTLTFVNNALNEFVLVLWIQCPHSLLDAACGPPVVTLRPWTLNSSAGQLFALPLCCRCVCLSLCLCLSLSEACSVCPCVCLCVWGGKGSFWHVSEDTAYLYSCICARKQLHTQHLAQFWVSLMTRTTSW